jgi:putative ATP-binding cassette transporter
VATNILSQWAMVRFAQDKLLGMCEELSKRAVQTPYRTLEAIGPARILTTLSDDVAILSAAIQAIPSLAGNAAIMIGCLLYLAWLSGIAAVVMTIVTALGAVCYKLLVGRAYKTIREARAGRDTLFRHFRSLTEGVKEIKMSRDRQSMVIGEIVDTAHHLRKKNLAAAYDYLKADCWAQIMFYTIIGMLLFALPSYKTISIATLTAYALVALYFPYSR